MTDVSGVNFIRSCGLNHSWPIRGVPRRSRKWIWGHCVPLWSSMAAAFSVTIRTDQSFPYRERTTSHTFWRCKLGTWSDICGHL